MFETIDGTEIELPLLADGRSRHWSFVRQHLFMPWFYLTYCVEAEEDMKVFQMLCLTQLQDLLDTRLANYFKVVEVNIVLPKYMTNKKRWTMEPLAEIWSGTEPEHDQQGYVYVTASGGRYFWSPICDHEDQLKNLELIYSGPAQD